MPEVRDNRIIDWADEPRSVRDGERIAAAISLAVTAHAGQVDKAGHPYIEHVLRVGAGAAWHSIDAMIVGILHDVVEDTPVKLDQIRAMFGDRVALAVDAITHREGESYDDYFERLVRNGLARHAKLSDLYDNSSPERRFEGPRYDKLMERYRKSIDRLLKIDGWLHSVAGRKWLHADER